MRRAILLRLICVACLLAAVPACASLPPHLPERGLYVDLRKAVETRESDEWVADRLEVEDLARTAIRSACQVDPAARERLLAWLDGRIEEEGGPVEDAYRREGSLRPVRELLRLSRVRQLLVHVSDLAVTECPFWLDEDPDFAGVQADEGRFVLFLESMGGGRVTIQDGDVALGGGGGARVMPGVGIGPRVTLAAGGEFGGNGSLPENDDGTRSFTARFAFAAPLLMRIHRTSRVIDMEVAATWRLRNDEVQNPPGFRFGFGYGITTLRVSRLKPHALLWIGYELVPERDGEAIEHTLWLGTRVGFSWDP